MLIERSTAVGHSTHEYTWHGESRALPLMLRLSPPRAPTPPDAIAAADCTACPDFPLRARARLSTCATPRDARRTCSSRGRAVAAWRRVWGKEERRAEVEEGGTRAGCERGATPVLAMR